MPCSRPPPPRRGRGHVCGTWRPVTEGARATLADPAPGGAHRPGAPPGRLRGAGRGCARTRTPTPAGGATQVCEG